MQTYKRRLAKLEQIQNSKQAVVIFQHMDSDGDGIFKDYTFSDDKKGKRTFYKKGVKLTEKDLDKFGVIIVDDISLINL